jgi:hypothetical protein
VRFSRSALDFSSNGLRKCWRVGGKTFDRKQIYMQSKTSHHDRLIPLLFVAGAAV